MSERQPSNGRLSASNGRLSVLSEAMLDAGAVLPTGAPVTKDDTVDTLTARAYRHPALDGRLVVRLIPGMLGAAEDLSLEFLAFAAPERVDEVGLVRQQALGFPAWALVHDPANGHHALALVKEIEKLARTAKSRVGPANEGFNALAERLSRSVPHFLPTFYEEAGRAFLAADSPSYAAMMFGKAREAERSYGLAIDEDRTHAVFLEFALAGALTAKALSGHARDLAGRCEPAMAYERFRKLCVERTLGGLPPYAGMHTDLRRLAKASGLDLVQADGLVLADLLAAPAILRAPAAFWTAYQGSLTKLGARDPVLRGKLLAIFPDNCPDDVWLTILDGAGAIAALTATTPGEVPPDDGAAGWLTRFVAHREKRSWRDTKRLPALLALVERMAARLIADGTPVRICGDGDDVDLDLLDACLAAGVPVADPHPGARLPVSHWLSDETEGRRELAAIAADDRFRALLRAATGSSLGQDNHQLERVAAVLAVPGLRQALGWWLAELADSVLRQGLPALRAVLDRMKLAASPAGFAVNPEAVGRVANYDLGPLLGRTLRAGVLDEYGWPAWDEAVTRLAGVKTKDDDDKLSLTRQWPVLVARRGDLVLAVGADRIELEHEMQIPKNQRSWMYRLALRHVDGALLVCWDKGPDRAGYWTNQPDDVFVVPDDAFDTTDRGGSLPLPDGGRTSGGPPLRVGDQRETSAGSVASDGTSYWVLTTVDKKAVWREYDPATGQPGRISLPGFFAAAGESSAAGGELELGECWLRPALTAVPENPFGQRDGLLGWRVRRTPDGGRSGAGIDGRHLELSGPVWRGLPGRLAGVVRFPGSAATFALLSSSGYRSSSATLSTADGWVLGQYELGSPKQKFARGTDRLPPLMFWHHMRPRDLAGSAALRALTDERAGALLAGAAGLDRAGVTELVARELPELTHLALIAGVAGIVRQAAKRAATLREFATVLSGQSGYPKPKKGQAAKAAPVAVEHLAAAPDDTLYAALGEFMSYCIRRGHSGIQLFEAAAGALTAPQPPAGKWAHKDTDVDWYDLFGVLPVAMYLAVLPGTDPEQRAALLVLLDTYANSGLSAPGGALRRVNMEAEQESSLRAGTVLQVQWRRLLITQAYGTYVAALEYAPDGQFGPIPGHAITGEQVMALPARAGELVRLVRENGAPTWDPQLATILSEAAGISNAEAVFLLAGLPRGAQTTDLGLSPALVQMARSAWSAHGRHAELFGRLLPEDPAALWTTGPRLDLVVAEQVARHGRRRPVADDLLELAHKAGIAEPMPASELLHGMANPDTCPWLVPRSEHENPSVADVGSVADVASVADVVVAVARAVPWLAYHLPADHPIRPRLPEVTERARLLLRDPAVAVSVGYLDEKKVDRVVTALGGNPIAGPEWIEVGPVRIEATDDWRTVQVRPALLTGLDDPALAVLRTRLDDTESDFLAALRLLLGGTAETGQSMVESEQSIVDYPVPHDPSWSAHDPSRSAVALVTEVAGKTGLSADAAALYLQLLALPDPTDRNVARWTGWKPARLAAARKELAATDLVVEAKRPRAGRSLFLPGGWLALRAPHLPVERWKIPLLTLDEEGTAALDVVVPVAPPPRLFELAWQRVTSGDTPRFDELPKNERR